MREMHLGPADTFDAAMLERESAFDADALHAATDIVADVRERGDAALREYSERFDGVSLVDFEVTPEEIEAATERVDGDFLAALEYAADNIRTFHERELEQSWFTTRDDGAITGQKVTAISRAGIYVPGGRAQYPSTVLMNAVPARVAGVDEVVMCTPCAKDGSVDPHTLAAAEVAGVDRIFKVGGAQAIAAMAYGTETVPKVEKVTGPGNAYVAAAKKLVNGDVGIDMIAGPSEVCVLADETAIPEFVAVDLMAQAEHDPRATCYLVTTEAALVPEVEEALAELMGQTTRREITEASLEHALVITCETLTQAFDAVNAIAPEHLELHMSEPFELLGRVKNAGAIFLGPWTPEAVGDYVAGPNHTLPTGGTAAFSSPLSVADFMKKSSVLSWSFEALERDSAAVETLAAREGLWSHGRSVDVRMSFMDYVQKMLAEGDDGEHDSCGCGCDTDTDRDDMHTDSTDADSDDPDADSPDAASPADGRS